MSMPSTATIIILSYCYTTDHVHPLYSHNHHSILLLHHRPCPSSLQPQSSFCHTATPQTMPTLSTATVIILSYCYTTDHAHPLYSHSHHSVILLHHRPCPPSLRYTTDHAHPLYSHSHHSVILLHHRPCPSSPQPQSSFYHTATPQTMPTIPKSQQAHQTPHHRPFCILLSHSQ